VIFVLIVLLVVLLGVSWPWSGVLIAAAVVLEIGEIALLRGWSRRLERRNAARDADEELIGELASVTSACRPRGQVRIRGELWEAVCEAGADPGEQVAVEAVEGLTLVVGAPVARAGATP
jgi:membrane protein implicated in regulation of membrane protease activity